MVVVGGFVGGAEHVLLQFEVGFGLDGVEVGADHAAGCQLTILILIHKEEIISNINLTRRHSLLPLLLHRLIILMPKPLLRRRTDPILAAL